MTGYESKRAAARDKLIQDAFDEWWDSNRKTLSPSNPCMTDSFEYWAWEGWHAALALTSTKCEVQPAQEPVAREQLLHLVDAYVEASAKCDHILEHYAQTEFQIAQAKADLAKARTTFKSSIVALLFAAPPQRPWVGLTEEEFDELEYRFARYELYRAIEAALRSKNNG